MKNALLTLVLAGTITTLSAQNKTEKKDKTDFNKWSVELGAGVNKIQRPMTSGYFTSTPDFLVGDLGVRYMFNNKFGLKANFGYNSFTGKNSSIDFDTRYYRADIQAVANLGRILNFETWTNTIGILGHAGVGVAQLEDQNSSKKDRMGNVMAGITGQIKLSNRIALTADFTTILNANQDIAFDAASKVNSRGFSGILFNGTVGITAYLGKNEKHADWVVVSPEFDSSELESKIADLEALVNKIPEKQVIVEKQVAPAPVVQKDVMKEMINEKYYSVYFEFNKATPIENSTAAIDVVLTYLRKNSSATLDILGNADQVGNSEYNERLSNARANNVKTIFEQAGIASSRLNVVANGADTSIQKDSEEARRLARRVTFKVN